MMLLDRVIFLRRLAHIMHQDAAFGNLVNVLVLHRHVIDAVDAGQAGNGSDRQWAVDALQLLALLQVFRRTQSCCVTL